MTRLFIIAILTLHFHLFLQVTSTKPDESLSVNSHQDSATTSPASETSEDRRASGGDLVENGCGSVGISGDFDNTNDEPLNMSSSSRLLPANQYESSNSNTRSARNDALPGGPDADIKPNPDLIQMNPDSNMNYQQAQASAASLLQAPFPLAQNLAYPYINMSLPLLQYNLPQTLMARAPPVSASTLPTVTTSTADSHSFNSSPSSRDQQQQSTRKSSTPEGQGHSQGQALVNGNDSWDRAVPCRECGKMLKSERMLDLHMNTAHTHKTGLFYTFIFSFFKHSKIGFCCL